MSNIFLDIFFIHLFDCHHHHQMIQDNDNRFRVLFVVREHVMHVKHFSNEMLIVNWWIEQENMNEKNLMKCQDNAVLSSSSVRSKQCLEIFVVHLFIDFYVFLDGHRCFSFSICKWNSSIHPRSHHARVCISGLLRSFTRTQEERKLVSFDLNSFSSISARLSYVSALRYQVYSSSLERKCSLIIRMMLVRRNKRDMFSWIYHAKAK